MSEISHKTSAGKQYFALNEVSAPVVIIGSSRASHHYVTQIIEDSLDMETYNVGLNGCYFSNNLAVLNSILDRYCPEIIIWEINRDYFLAGSEDPIESLYPYYNKNRNITALIKEKEKTGVLFCLKSALYRYNSNILYISANWLRGQIKGNIYKLDSKKGYEPLASKEWKEENDYSGKNRNVIDTLKIRQLGESLKRAQMGGVELILVESPYFSTGSSNEPLDPKNAILDAAVKNHIVYIDNTQLDQIVKRKEYFYDRVHLSNEGAEKYTELFVDQLQEILLKN